MKKLFYSASLLLAAGALMLTSCNSEQNQDAKLEIRSLTIVNGGLSATERIDGQINETEATILFENVPAETDLDAIEFESRVSVGSKLDKSVYDFYAGSQEGQKEFTQTVSVVNDIVGSKEYSVTIRIQDAKNAPILNYLVVKDDKGVERTITATNVVDGVLLLGVEDSPTATIMEVKTRPSRATYKFTTAQDGVISSSNRGEMQIEFEGLNTTYPISFASAPKAGGDFENAKIHKWNFESDNIYVDFLDERTRGGDMDENYVLVVNGAASGATPNPYLLNVEDLLNDNATNKLPLDVTGVEGGTFYVSAGRLAQGHIYVCNLPSAGVSEVDEENLNKGPLKIYHWADASAKPEVVLEWTGELDNMEDPYSERLGDNMSISLDASGNGYAFFCQQEGSGRVIRFTVKNFTEFSEPTNLQMKGVYNYYGMYNKVGENEYIHKSTYSPTMLLVDKDGTLLYQIDFDNGKEGGNATDYRIVEFNRARYLIGSNGRMYNWYKPEAIVVFDITEGTTNAAALKAMSDNREIDPESFDPEFPEYLPYEPIFKYRYGDAEATNGMNNCGVALCATVVKDGKLLIWSAAPRVGMTLMEVSVN